MTSASANRRRQPVFVPNGRSAGSAPYRGMPRTSATSRSALARRVRHEMAEAGIGDERADLRDDPGAREQLLGERAPGAVVRGHHVQPAPRVARDHARQQPEVVLDDALGHGAAGHVDHLQPRLPEQEQQEQEPLLERLHRRAVLRLVGRDRRQHDDRLARLVAAHRLPDRHEALLQLREAGAALAVAEIAEPGRARGEVGHVACVPGPRRARPRCRRASAARTPAG